MEPWERTRGGESGVEVPREALSPEVLRRLVEEFVTRDGTDYGEQERSLEEKVDDVLRQLDRGEIRILFDAEAETVTLAPAR